jgi:hypothetical protein
MRIDVAIILSALSLVVSTADFFASRARSKRLEDRESVIEAKEATLESRIEKLKKTKADKSDMNTYHSKVTREDESATITESGQVLEKAGLSRIEI